MRRSNPSMTDHRCLWRDETGSAALEFITVGVILLVPFIYLVIALGTVQHQMLGAEAAARHTARAISAADGPADAEVRAEQAMAATLAEYDMAAADVSVDLRCIPAGVTCPSAGTTIAIQVSTRVQMPFVPPIFGLDRVTSIPIEAAAVQRVSRTWRDR